jgi:aminoglycoside 3-N-acetyltransferase
LSLKLGKKKDLFFFKNKNVSNFDIFNSLKKIQAHESDVLYIHTELNFGYPNKEISRKDLLKYLYEIIFSLDVSTLIFPTYTFSFCNNLDFNIKESKTSMGILNEFVRNQNDGIRSIDPLMSNFLIGKNQYLVNNIKKHSIGKDSTFDLLYKSKLNVKFLFFGPNIGDCFTFMHYIENNQKINYRYNKRFSGEIFDGINQYKDSYYLFVRYSDIFSSQGSYIYENILYERKIGLRKKIGAAYLSIAEMNYSYNLFLELLDISPSFFIKNQFNKYLNKKSFLVNNMVSL